MYLVRSEAQSLHKIDNFIAWTSYKTTIQYKYLQNVPLCHVHLFTLFLFPVPN